MIATANMVGSITVTNPGLCMSQPLIFLTNQPGVNGTGATATALLSKSLIATGKNMTEGFDVEYGRMDIRLGSTPNALTPNVGNGFVLGLARYIDPPTEVLNDGEVILWRLTHLGVDSHSMHFHLFDVQVVNRVDFTNVVKPPYLEEIGWKETIRTNPMEDTFLAIKPQSMTFPFPIPNSNRLLDPTTPINSTANFFPVAPPAGIVAVAQQTNVMTNFGWEYVWHCHLLGHEENDMMRPIALVVTAPVAPTTLVANVVATGPASVRVDLSWASTAVNAAGYKVDRSTTSTFTAATTTSFNIVGAANMTYSDNSALTNTVYYYRVSAMNGAGTSTPSNVVTVRTVVPPIMLAPTITAGATDTVVINWTAGANPTNFTLQRLDFTNGLVSYTVAGNLRQYTQTGLPKGATFWYRIRANITGASSSFTPQITVNTP
jgi:FtsP/CotA-like multicopper oxidase with cupredoxin domain